MRRPGELAQYVDVSGPARRKAGAALEHFVEAVAELTRDEIVDVMESSEPTGRRYPLPASRAPRKKFDEEAGIWVEIPGKWYTASAPGEPPAVRSGAYRDAFQVAPVARSGTRVEAGVFNPQKVGHDGVPLWEVLEYGTKDGRIKPRPHIRVAVERVRPKAQALAASGL